MPTREQVRGLLGTGLDYAGAAERLGIPAGQAYLIATGRPADGSDSPPGREPDPDALPSSQHLANPPHDNPTGSQTVLAWIHEMVAADTAMHKAAEQRTAEPSGDEDEESSTDVVMVLTRQHNKTRALLKQLSAIPGHNNGGTAEDLSQRKSIVDMVTVRLSQHEAAEEELLWPMVRKTLPDGDQWADGALAQEQEGKQTLAALGKLEPDTDEFDSLIEQLEAQCRKHVAYEYRVFLLLREAMPDEAREKLGQRILTAQKRAPTRPHKRTPQRPAAAVKAAGAAAAVDKARDAATGRPAQRQGKPTPESQDQA